QFLSFDVSDLAGQTYGAPRLSIFVDSDGSTTDFTVVAYAKTWLPGLASGDFVPGASLSGLTELATLATSSISGSGFTVFTETGTALRDAIASAAAGSGKLEIVLVSSRQ